MARAQWIAFLIIASLSYAIHVAGGLPSNIDDPVPLERTHTHHRRWNDSASPMFKQQVQNPSGIFTVLLLIGGDIVHMAIAQQAGSSITFVAFSFGWVSFSFRALVMVFGDGKFMPSPDCSAVVIDAKSKMKKANNSWVLGRLIRDLELNVARGCADDPELLDHSGLVITFYQGSRDRGTPGKPEHDWWWRSFFLTFTAQLGLTIWPLYDHGNWSILFLTVIGTTLAIMTGSLPEWKREKYKCRQGSQATYILTRGNGHKQAFVIQKGDLDNALFLDDLAGGIKPADTWSRFYVLGLAFLWVIFLIVAAGVEMDTWFFLGAGGIGMTQNILIAGVPRQSQALGIPLRRIANRTYGLATANEHLRVRQALEQLAESHGPGRCQECDRQTAVRHGRESKCPDGVLNAEIAIAIRQEFLPDYALRAEEKVYWDRIVGIIR